MKRLFALAAALVLIAGLAMTACDSSDSSDSGEGGTTPTAATSSSMAGKWDVILVIAKGVSRIGSVSIDANGVVTKYMSPWWYCGGPIYGVRVTGSLTQTGGDVQYGCPGFPANIIFTDRMKLRTVNPDRLAGSIELYFRSQLAAPILAIILVRK